MSPSGKKRSAADKVVDDDDDSSPKKTATMLFCKRLKSSEPDLEISCRYENKNSGASFEEKTFHTHSVLMALYSNYFDGLLSSEMREAGTKQVTLQDMPPRMFELSMNALEQSFDLHSLPLKDHVGMAEVYNRLDIAEGLKVLVQPFLLDFMKDQQAIFCTAPINDNGETRPTRVQTFQELEIFVKVTLIAQDNAEAMTEILKLARQTLVSLFGMLAKGESNSRTSYLFAKKLLDRTKTFPPCRILQNLWREI